MFLTKDEIEYERWNKGANIEFYSWFSWYNEEDIYPLSNHEDCVLWGSRKICGGDFVMRVAPEDIKRSHALPLKFKVTSIYNRLGTGFSFMDELGRWYYQNDIFPILTLDNRDIKIGDAVFETLNGRSRQIVKSIIRYDDGIFGYYLSDHILYTEKFIEKIVCENSLGY